MLTLEQRKSPIGGYKKNANITREMRNMAIEILRNFPDRLEALTMSMTADQLNLSYRAGGWTARQIVHHLADSHMNMYIRMKFTLTMDNPTIMPYDENLWAAFPEARESGIQISIGLLKSLHTRIVGTLDQLTDDQFLRTYYHPDLKRTLDLNELVMLYSWHADHHLAQINVVAQGHGEN
jgi:hypothetical protein